MNVKYFFLALTIQLVTSLFLGAQEITQFRGPNAVGKYSDTKLLKEWPANGPDLLWEAKGLGNGYGSPVFKNNRIYVNGEIDSLTYLFALDKTGNILWKSPIGEEWVSSYPGARSTPTVVDDLVYVSAGMGAVACFDANSGEQKWSRNMLKEFGAVNTRFGFAESIVNYGDLVFCTPGGKEMNVVALNRFSGEVEWVCGGKGEMPSFCTPLVLELPRRNLLLTFSMSHLLAIDIETGELLWTHQQAGEGDVHVNTPLYEDGFLYYVAGNGNGAVKLEISDDGMLVKQHWGNNLCDNLNGGFIKLNNHIYTSSYSKRKWYSLNTMTGDIVDSLKFDNGITIFADDRLYLYNERGRVSLCNATDGKFEKISEFKLRYGTKAHFSHPVINNGILYIRRGNSLMAYDVRSKDSTLASNEEK